METISKVGQKSIDIIHLTDLFGLPISYTYTEDLFNSIKKFQGDHGLTVDGVIGPKTWEKIKEIFPKRDEVDWESVARDLNVEVAAIKAVCEVESGSLGAFFASGQPTILFEGHIFWSELKKVGKDPNKITGNSDILFPKWTKKYLGGYKEWGRLNRAFNIDPTAGLSSASLGLFQIMGFNYSYCGCKNVLEFYARSYRGKSEQIKMFSEFIRSRKLDVHLRSKNWASFAKGYNGPLYAANKYDVKLQNAYKKYA